MPAAVGTGKRAVTRDTDHTADTAREHTRPGVSEGRSKDKRNHAEEDADTPGRVCRVHSPRSGTQGGHQGSLLGAPPRPSQGVLRLPVPASPPAASPGGLECTWVGLTLTRPPPTTGPTRPPLVSVNTALLAPGHAHSLCSLLSHVTAELSRDRP